MLGLDSAVPVVPFVHSSRRKAVEEGQECASLLSKRTMREQRDLPPPGQSG